MLLIFLVLILRTDLSSGHWMENLRRLWHWFIDSDTFHTLASAGCRVIRSSFLVYIPQEFYRFVDEFIDCDSIVTSVMGWASYSYFSTAKLIGVR